MGNVNSSVNEDKELNNMKDPFFIIQKFTKDNTILFEEFLKKFTDKKLEDEIKVLEKTTVITDDTLSNSCTADKRITRDTKHLNIILKTLQPYFKDKFTYKRNEDGSYFIELLSVPSWIDNKINYTDVFDFLNKINPYMNAFITYSSIPFTNCSVSIRRLLEKYKRCDIKIDYKVPYRLFKKILVLFIKENYCNYKYSNSKGKHKGQLRGYNKCKKVMTKELMSINTIVNL